MTNLYEITLWNSKTDVESAWYVSAEDELKAFSIACKNFNNDKLDNPLIHVQWAEKVEGGLVS